MRFNVPAMSGKAVEAPGDVQTLILDNTETITPGDREANDFIAVAGRQQNDLVQAVLLASYFDTTPEERSDQAHRPRRHRQAMLITAVL